MKARSGAPTQATDRFRDSRDAATGCKVPLASSTVIFRLGLDVCLHPARAVGEVPSHPHCSLLVTQKMTSRSSFDTKLTTAPNQPRLCSRSRLYLWRGIRLEIGCGIARFLPVGLTVRAWCTHAVGGKSGQRGGLNLRRRASPQFLSLDKVLVEVMREEMLIYKGRVLAASRVTSRITVLMQTRLQAFLKIGHCFKDFWNFWRLCPESYVTDLCPLCPLTTSHGNEKYTRSTPA